MFARQAMLTLAALLSAATWAQGQAAAQTAEKAEPAQELEVTLARVVGSVDVRRAGQDRWIAAREQMLLGKGARVSTGPASRAELLLSNGEGSGGVITVMSFTLLTVDEHLRRADTIHTRLTLKIGAVRARVLPTKLETDFRISTPSLSCSVRGSEIDEVSYFPDADTQVRAGELDPEHGLVCADELGRNRRVDSHERTDADLVHTVDALKEDQNVVALPEGHTRDEEKAAVLLPDPIAVSPGGTLDRAIHPTVERIVIQEKEVLELETEPIEAPLEGSVVTKGKPSPP